jgi:chemotaxis protein methyltransferase CheR
MESIMDLWSRLLKDRDFHYPFIDELTVGLTALFRDPILWNTLKKSALKNFAHKEQLDIWHAGCSTAKRYLRWGLCFQKAAFKAKQRLATDINNHFCELPKKENTISV